MIPLGAEKIAKNGLSSKRTFSTNSGDISLPQQLFGYFLILLFVIYFSLLCWCIAHIASSHSDGCCENQASKPSSAFG